MSADTVIVLVAALLALVAAGVAVGFVAWSRKSGTESPPAPPRDEILDAKVSELANKLESIERTVTSQKAALEAQVMGIDTKVGTIAQLFTNDRARGNWGEISLLRILELGQLTEGRDFATQVPVGNGIADAVVYLPGERRIVVDAKFPVARYLEALDREDPEERGRLLTVQAKELERVGKELISRGYAEAASGGYVVMYLPSQAVYEAVAEASPEVIERLLAQRVVVAGPTALYALMANVAALLTEYRALRRADEILESTRELHKRMGVFIGHLGDVGLSLARTVTAFNKAAGSWEKRLAPHLNRLGELTGAGDGPPLTPIDEPVREVSDHYPRLAASNDG